jgi:hypothetical protein
LFNHGKTILLQPSRYASETCLLIRTASEFQDENYESDMATRPFVQSLPFAFQLHGW